MDKWDRVTKDVEWDESAARSILFTLFPVLETNQAKRNRGYRSQATTQSILDDSVSDYWNRYNQERIADDDLSDQAVIRAIKLWQKDDTEPAYEYNGQAVTLAQAIFECPCVPQKIEQFGHLFEPAQIRRLATQLFDIAFATHGKAANAGNCPGFEEMWRLSLDKRYEKHKAWLIGEINKALGVSLHFTNDLYYFSLHVTNELYYFWRGQYRTEIKSEPATPGLRKVVVEKFRKMFENKPEKLAKTLDPANPCDLREFVFAENADHREDWSWLGRVLLAAAKEQPRLTAGYVACLVSETQATLGERDKETRKLHIGYKCRINHDVIKQIFGEDNTGEVMQLLSGDYEYPELADDFRHGQTRAVIANAREEARIWLDENLGA